MRDTTSTLAFLNGQHANPTQSWYRLCLQLARTARGLPDTYPRAYVAWQEAKDKHPLTPECDWHNVPRGAPIFYYGQPDGGLEYGHVATFIGVTKVGPLVWSNDVVEDGKVNLVSPLWFLSHWGMTLLGWTGDLDGVDLHLVQNTPVVSLPLVQQAARMDPGREQGGTTPSAAPSVLLVEKAMCSLGYLPAEYVDGSFGSLTVEAYSRWQKTLGYTGPAANGIPGFVSMTRLGDRFGFKVSTT